MNPLDRGRNEVSSSYIMLLDPYAVLSARSMLGAVSKGAGHLLLLRAYCSYRWKYGAANASSIDH